MRIPILSINVFSRWLANLWFSLWELLVLSIRSAHSNHSWVLSHLSAGYAVRSLRQRRSVIPQTRLTLLALLRKSTSMAEHHVDSSLPFRSIITQFFSSPHTNCIGRMCWLWSTLHKIQLNDIFIIRSVIMLIFWHLYRIRTSFARFMRVRRRCSTADKIDAFVIHVN